MPGLDDVLAAHLAHLRLLGRSERTVYDRERAVVRLAAWLHARCDPVGIPGSCEECRRYDGHLIRGLCYECREAARMIAEAETNACAERRADSSPPDLRAVMGLSVLQATAEDLAAWRASLTVGDQAVVVYCAHVAGFYDFAVTRGIRPDNPAAGR